MESKKPQIITEEDIKTRNIQRRSFLGRLGTAVGVIAFSSACGQSEQAESSDSDGSQSDSDGSKSESYCIQYYSYGSHSYS
ncbi:MAG: twin-arginine translocation signal domain-containing protein, partial [Gemmatimonadetes bacterium]|nr:twin-arginine translocation signal domain-containing protein [Gemmatimonadota bacterium]